MGLTLTPQMMEAFASELEMMDKEAGVLDSLAKFFGRGSAVAAKGTESMTGLMGRLRHPVEGLAAGWKTMAPRGWQTAERTAEIAARGKPTGIWGRFSEPFRAGKHLTEHMGAPRPLVGEGSALTGSGAQGIGRLQGTAEELSRRGWTGKGNITKYLPVGEKGMVMGFPLATIPSYTKTEKPTPTGEGGTLQRAMGDIAGTGAMVLTGGLGAVAGIGSTLLGAHFAGKAGRVLDRLRGGATIGQAITAPSPTEAAAQMAKIQKYYGTPE